MRTSMILTVLIFSTGCGREIEDLATAIHEVAQVAQDPNVQNAVDHAGQGPTPVATPVDANNALPENPNAAPAATPLPDSNTTASPSVDPNATPANGNFVSMDMNRWYGTYQTRGDTLVGVSTCARCADHLQLPNASNDNGALPPSDVMSVVPGGTYYANLNEDMPNALGAAAVLAADGTSIQVVIPVNIASDAALANQVNPGLCGLTARHFDITYTRTTDSNQLNARQTVRDVHELMCQGGHAQECTCTYEADAAIFYANNFSR